MPRHRTRERYIARELTVAVVALVAVISALVITIGYLYSSSVARAELEEKADEHLTYLTTSLQRPLWTLDEPAVLKICQAFARGDDLALLEVVTAEGEILYHHDRPPDGYGTIDRQASIVFHGAALGRVRLSMSLGAYTRANRMRLWSSIITVLAIVVALLALTGLVVGRLLRRPLSELRQRIEGLSRGVYTGDGAALRYHELDVIAQRFDEMANQVQGREASLRLANQRLQEEIAERRRAEASLQESQSRYRQLIDSISDILYTHDLEGRITTVSRAGSLILDMPVGRIVGQKLTDFMPEALRDGFGKEYLDRLRRDGSAEGVVQMVDARGEVHYLEYRARVVRQEEGVSLVSGSARDITERVLSRREVKKLEEQLRHSQKMEAVGTLASGIAHDFNNILQSISGHIQLLLRGDNCNQGMREQLGDIDQTLSRAAALVRRLLTFSRKVEGRPKPLDLNQEVEQTAKILARTIPRMIDIELDLAEGLPLIMGDAFQIEQVLMNLGANAKDAMPDGGALKIQTRPGLKPGGEETGVEMVVSDTGNGMDQQTLEHIFEPFYTTKGPGSGTGLGLFTVYGIIKAHGGVVGCDSQPGQGASFRIWLPAGQAQEQQPERGEAAESDEAPPGGETVLVVDDERAILEVAEALLTDLGYEVLTADSGEAALEAHQTHGKVDAVVMDLGMPGMGGRAAIARLKERDPGLRVLVASGYADEAMLAAVDEAGADDTLAKPYRLAELARKLRELLDKPAEATSAPTD